MRTAAVVRRGALARRSSSSAGGGGGRAATLEKFEGSVMKTYGRYDIVLSHGAGREVWDADGKRYLDMGGGIAVNALGHSHPEVVDVIQEQATKLVHCSNLYYTEPQGQLGDALAGLFADGRADAGGKIFFCNSGAEANEGMFKLARAWGQRDGVDTDPATAKYEIITAENSFHGRTVAAIAATGQDKIKAGFGPMIPGFKHVAFNDLQAAADAVGPQTAAIMIEGIQGEGGIMPATVDYLLGLRKLCDERGILLLFDAVQCGHFRSGRFQSYQTILEEASASGNAEAAAFMPDAVSMAKSLGAGVPIGGFWVAEKHAGLLSAGMHGTTYGGNAMACAVGHKVIEIVHRDGLEENIRAVGDQFAEGFSKLCAAYPTVIADHRGLGLMRGIVLQPKEQIPGFADQDGSPSGQFVNKLHELGMLTVGSGDQVVRVLPPFNTTHAEAEEALSHIETAAKFAAGL